MSLSSKLGTLLKKQNFKISTAESCTAGLIAATIADTPGSSDWLDSGYIVYTPRAKNEILGVHYKTIDKYNITSCNVAEEMAKGVQRNRPNINVVLTTTGLAGPGGGTIEIPSGTICFGWLYNIDGQILIYSEKHHFNGTRNEIRQQATEYALSKTIAYLENLDLSVSMPSI